ncbi:uncharacterized protein LOC126335893 [Schistocerca gregaria]|uniref:uncharacterized protein LOC126335893 n=1 Tax=Schistocerca gregaria TaxID=7010 RepID=UPI00211EB23D|nr:uncharacterized protein LOC126335893 [Schistocerca gregaria]
MANNQRIRNKLDTVIPGGNCSYIDAKLEVECKLGASGGGSGSSRGNGGPPIWAALCPAPLPAPTHASAPAPARFPRFPFSPWIVACALSAACVSCYGSSSRFPRVVTPRAAVPNGVSSSSRLRNSRSRFTLDNALHFAGPLSPTGELSTAAARSGPDKGTERTDDRNIGIACHHTLTPRVGDVKSGCDALTHRKPQMSELSGIAISASHSVGKVVEGERPAQRLADHPGGGDVRPVQTARRQRQRQGPGPGPGPVGRPALRSCCAEQHRGLEARGPARPPLHLRTNVASRHHCASPLTGDLRLLQREPAAAPVGAVAPPPERAAVLCWRRGLAAAAAAAAAARPRRPHDQTRAEAAGSAPARPPRPTPSDLLNARNCSASPPGARGLEHLNGRRSTGQIAFRNRLSQLPVCSPDVRVERSQLTDSLSVAVPPPRKTAAHAALLQRAACACIPAPALAASPQLALDEQPVHSPR